MEVLYDGVLRATQIDQEERWVFIRWMEPGKKKLQLLKDFLKVEEIIRQSKLRGWYASSEKDHTVMHKIMEKVGARQYNEDAHGFHFMKEVI